jgi:adenylosuccinate synthase
LDSIAFTLLDVLTEIEELKICVGYKYGNKITTDPPSHHLELAKVQPVYLTMEGWDSDITGVRNKQALPQNARLYLEAIEDILEIPIDIVSVGRDRAQTFLCK